MNKNFTSLSLYKSAVARSYAIDNSGAHVRPRYGVLFAGVVNPRGAEGELELVVFPFHDIDKCVQAFTVNSNGEYRWTGNGKIRTVQATASLTVRDFYPVQGKYTNSIEFELQAANALQTAFPNCIVKHNPSGKRLNSRDIEVWDKNNNLLFLIEVKGRQGRMFCESVYLAESQN